MTAYCMREMPMGDLHMANYTCDDHASQVIEVGGEITTRSPQCAAYCNHRLAEVRNGTCGIPCAKVPTCDECVPPPPPPPPSAPPPCPPYGTPLPPGAGAVLRAMLLQLQKFCYSFEPPSGFEAATELDDADHWDSGMWLPPAPFDWLVDMYAPWQCAGAATRRRRRLRERGRVRHGVAGARFLSLFARQHPEICRSSLHEVPRLLHVAVRAAAEPAADTREGADALAAPFSGKAPLGPWHAALPGPALRQHEPARRAARDPSRGAARGARAAVPLLKLITLTLRSLDHPGAALSATAAALGTRVGIVSRRMVVDQAPSALLARRLARLARRPRARAAEARAPPAPSSRRACLLDEGDGASSAEGTAAVACRRQSPPASPRSSALTASIRRRRQCPCSPRYTGRRRCPMARRAEASKCDAAWRASHVATRVTAHHRPRRP